MNSIQMNTLELARLESKRNNDDRDMARLGKNQVLKVWRPICFPVKNDPLFF